MKKRYYFCGIGGNGMSPLARYLAQKGHEVFGSDRSFDDGVNLEFAQELESEGITLCSQDGGAVTENIDSFVVTRAVEESIPDIKRARELNLPIQKRPELMANLFAETKNIAIGGTSGKSTTTGMVGHILKELGHSPTIVNGAIMINSGSNISMGNSDTVVFEADESDGLNDVVSLCPRDIAVITNISLDHFELDALLEIFEHFAKEAKTGVVLNSDCSNSRKLIATHPHVVTFGFNEEADISSESIELTLQLLGSHNRANALAALAAVSLLGIKPEEAAGTLQTFRGIHRRLELVGIAQSGTKVYDDFASNPGKISASLTTLKEACPRLMVIFQPHGFAATKMMKDGYIETFRKTLSQQDLLVIPPIYYAGGTHNIVDGKEIELPKDISSEDLKTGLEGAPFKVLAPAKREEVLSIVRENGPKFNGVVVMGSRDPSLSDLAKDLLEQLDAGTKGEQFR